MRVAIVLLIVAMIAKDTSHIGDRFVLRGLTEGLCLAFACFWWATRANMEIALRYSLVLAYIAIIFTLSVAKGSLELTLQAGSLVSVVIFFISYIETYGAPGNTLVLNTTISTYFKTYFYM